MNMFGCGAMRFAYAPPAPVYWLAPIRRAIILGAMYGDRVDLSCNLGEHDCRVLNLLEIIVLSKKQMDA